MGGAAPAPFAEAMPSVVEALERRPVAWLHLARRILAWLVRLGGPARRLLWQCSEPGLGRRARSVRTCGKSAGLLLK